MTEDGKPPQSILLASREPYFAPVDLETSDIFCGDERQPIDVLEPYIHIFGGALFVPYNLIVVYEADNVATPAFADAAVQAVTKLKASGIRGLGVHSDEHAEGAEVFQHDRHDGKVGCGYAQLRADISALIAERGDEILGDIETRMPDLLTSPADREFAGRVLAAHGRLAKKQSVLGSGRGVVQAAAGAGAKVMLVAGDHVADKGLINTQKQSSFKSGEANAAGMAAYDHDLWASQALFDRMQTGLDSRQFALASAIDIIGTMKALGVEDIAVR